MEGATLGAWSAIELDVVGRSYILAAFVELVGAMIRGFAAAHFTVAVFHPAIQNSENGDRLQFFCNNSLSGIRKQFGDRKFKQNQIFNLSRTRDD